MRDRKVVSLLRRIALGLPVALGPLVLGLSTGGCTQCFTFARGGTSHPRSAFTDSFVGPPERFDPANCSTLCRMLDGLDPNAGDAATPDAGVGVEGWVQYRGSLEATCAYSTEGTILSCQYAERVCETNAGCGTAVYGRTPSGLVSRRSLASDAPARWLAEGAHLEAASVAAFEDLSAEFEAFGAPAALVQSARRSAHDERRHARALRGLAHRLGATVDDVRRVETGLRGPEAVAIDNAIEGCGREAYGAVAAAFQARHARSAAVRRAYRGIAADEARHALLSFAANDWLMPRLSSTARRLSEEARSQSLQELAVGLEHEPDHALGSVLGLPDATRANDLLSLLT